MEPKNPHKVTAVRKYGETKTKKKKARPIEGRKVQDAYFAKGIEKPQKHPFHIAWDNLVAKLPEDMRRNIAYTFR